MSDYKWIQVREIADYVYCRRAWWLQRMEGYQSQNIVELSRGTAFHEAHGEQVARSLWLNRLAYLLLGLAALVLIFSFVQTFF